MLNATSFNARKPEIKNENIPCVSISLKAMGREDNFCAHQKYGCPSKKDNNSTLIVIGKEHSECLAMVFLDLYGGYIVVRL